MPPTRRGSQASTETTTTSRGSTRTHGENQERAYIAASRRTDRSMEARMESARRASDLHQKRTGKRLRITEKIVQMEEMYEEEDPNYEERARRREQWMAPSFNYSGIPQSPGSFTYPQPLQIFPFQPTSSNSPTLNTNGSLSNISTTGQSPISPMSMQQQQHLQFQLQQQNFQTQLSPSSATFDTNSQDRSVQHTPQHWVKNEPQVDDSRTSQDLTFEFSSMLFGDPTMRPSGIQNPHSFSDFSHDQHLDQKSSNFESSTNMSNSSDQMLSMFAPVEGEEISQEDEWFNYGATSGTRT